MHLGLALLLFWLYLAFLYHFVSLALLFGLLRSWCSDLIYAHDLCTHYCDHWDWRLLSVSLLNCPFCDV